MTSKKKTGTVIAVIIVIICLMCSIVNYSSGGFPRFGHSFFYYSENQQLRFTPFIYSTPTVEISMGYTPPANTLVLYCTYTVTDSNQKTIHNALMLHYPFSSEYIISKTLTNLENGNYTFIINSHLANGTIQVPMNETFTVDTTFVEPKLTIISPQNQKTYNGSVEISFNINSNLKWVYYSLDSSKWTYASGNTTLYGLPEGSHQIIISVQTEANLHSRFPISSQTVNFNIER